MMSRRVIGLSAVLMLTAALASSGVGYADPKDGPAVAQFHCQISIVFPAPAPDTTAKSNCEGGANGVHVAPSGKPDVYLAGPSTASLLDKGLDNFLVYNVKYDEVCPVPVGLPPIGAATGHAVIQGAGLTTGEDAYVHAAFTYDRVGVVFVATLQNPHAHNGTFTKGHKSSKPGGVGVGAGILTAKEPFGTCDNPLNTEVVIDGVVVARINP